MLSSEYDKNRLNALLDILLRYTIMDFSRKADISDQGDEIDAIAAGVNALVEELEVKIRSLKENEERFRILIEEVRDYAIFMIDPNGYVMSWNKGAEKIKGYTAAEIIGKHFSIFYTEDELEHGEPERNLEMTRKLGR